jgi:hypothetical protein
MSNFVQFWRFIHSEYGMTRITLASLFFRNGVFECPAWMQILVRDTEDALTYIPDGKTGGINVIDLANINSCSFIATQDLGKKIPNSFEVLGRFDNSDIRGCNLMVFNLINYCEHAYFIFKLFYSLVYVAMRKTPI